jgi:hypothetical protein
VVARLPVGKIDRREKIVSAVLTPTLFATLADPGRFPVIV